jgi:hypothetical protein
VVALARVAWILTIGSMLCLLMVLIGLFCFLTIVLFPLGVVCFGVGFALLLPPF